jgi:hypothetical protein
MLGFVKSVFTPITNERPLYLKINRYSILTNFKQKVIKKKIIVFDDLQDDYMQYLCILYQRHL